MSTERALLRDGHDSVAGLDEVGRGSWAGPLVVGAVVADPGTARAPSGVRDSKQLAPEQRVERAAAIRRWCASWSLGIVSAREIDAMGMTAALTLASARALAALPVSPSTVLLDGNFDYVGVASPPLGAPPTGQPSVSTIVRGDQRSTCVAAASIVAKVARDAMMRAYGRLVPGYGFEQHKGYVTPGHRAAVAELGLSPLHRASWSCLVERDVGLEDADDDDLALAALDGLALEGVAR